MIQNNNTIKAATDMKEAIFPASDNLHRSSNEKFDHLWKLVGNTPMIEITYRYKGRPGRIFAKCEHYNLTGSIKDRMALYVLQQAYRNQTIHPGNTIVEATSGNTGIAFSAIGRALGHRVIIIMPNWLSRERVDIIKSLGAEAVLLSKEEGGFLGSIALSEKMAAEDQNIFLPRQFENRFNAEAHEMTTAREIQMQLQAIGLQPDAFVAGVGTGGTVMGVANYFRNCLPDMRIHPLEPAESPTLSTGFKVGAHRIQGISDEFIPAIVDLSQLNRVLKASDSDSIRMAQMLSGELGLAVGISSGANFIGAIQLQEELGPAAVVVTVFSDSNKKYLSTDLVKEQKPEEGQYSSDTVLIDYKAIDRL